MNTKNTGEVSDRKRMISQLKFILASVGLLLEEQIAQELEEIEARPVLRLIHGGKKNKNQGGNKVKSIILALITSFLLAACGTQDMSLLSSCGYLVNFDADPDGVPFTNRQSINSQYAAWGVTFSVNSSSPRVIDQATDPTDAVPVSDPFVLGAATQNSFDNSQPLTIRFSNAASDVEFYVIDAESAAGYATFFDDQGAVVDGKVFDSLTSGVAQLISSSANNVSSVVLTNGPGSPEGFFIDNLGYRQCP